MANSDIFAETLSYLNELPSDSSLWQLEIPNFLASLSAITDEKARQRESVRISLETFIKKFVVENSERLDWLGIERDDWGTFDRLSVDFLFEAKGFLESLGSLFDEYDSIPSEGPSMAETETLFEKKTGIFMKNHL